MAEGVIVAASTQENGRERLCSSESLKGPLDLQPCAFQTPESQKKQHLNSPRCTTEEA